MSHPHRKALAVGLTLTILCFAASSAATGAARLLWETALPPPLPFEVYEGVNSIAAADGVVIAGGWVDGFGNADMAVRAYDRRSGAALWQEKLDLADGYDAVDSVAARGGLATVLAEFDGRYESGFAVRTYEARTGTLLWEDRHANGATALDLRSGIVAVGGAQPAVRVWEARSGEPLWAHVGSDGDGFRDIAIRGGLVVCVGSTVGEGGDGDLLVRALDRRSGAVVWEDVWDDPSGHAAEAFEVIAWGSVVLVGGILRLNEQSQPQALVVRAYRRTTGELLWDDVLAGPLWRGLAVGGGGRTAVLAGGIDGDFVVRAYDVRNGELRWSDGRENAGPTGAATTVAVGRGSVVAGGYDVDGDFVVRAYDHRDGALRWADKHDEGGRDEAVQAVAIEGRTVVAGGYVARKASLIYFTVRAYEL